MRQDIFSAIMKAYNKPMWWRTHAAGVIYEDGDAEFERIKDSYWVDRYKSFKVKVEKKGTM